MRSLQRILMASALLIGLAFISQADEGSTESSVDAPEELTNQTHCPVMGGEIDSAAYTDIQGQRVYHCCAMCSAKLKADPDKYFKASAEKGVLYENIQTYCPVSGDTLEDKSVFTDFEGRRIAFCCEKCIGTFNEDPSHYLKKLDDGGNGEPEHMKEMDHSDHGGHSH